VKTYIRLLTEPLSCTAGIFVMRVRNNDLNGELECFTYHRNECFSAESLRVQWILPSTAQRLYVKSYPNLNFFVITARQVVFIIHFYIT
jgi:hypothetical protein